MKQCPCCCHTGAYAACDIPGGCGHLHSPNERRLDKREAARLLGDAIAAPVQHQPDVPQRVTTVPHQREILQRPAGACVIHQRPRTGTSWRRADDGFVTCADCYNRLHKWLSPLGVDDEGRIDNIPGLYAALDATPGNGGTGRRAPGFGSRSPASDRVIALKDFRTTQLDESDPYSVAGLLRGWVLWVWEERYDDAALDQPDYRQRRAELPTTVDAAAVWLDRNLDWLTRNEIIIDFYAELKELRRQLRSATGNGGGRPVGRCMEILADGECRAPIFMPKGESPRAPDEPIVTLPELTCGECGSKYSGHRLVLLKVAELRAAKAATGAGTPAA